MLKGRKVLGFLGGLALTLVCECQEALLWVDEVDPKEKQKVPELNEGKYMRRHSLRKRNQCAALVVGHYCHDQLTLHGGEVAYSLGGSVSYITNVFGALGMECKVSQLHLLCLGKLMNVAECLLLQDFFRAY